MSIHETNAVSGTVTDVETENRFPPYCDGCGKRAPEAPHTFCHRCGGTPLGREQNRASWQGAKGGGTPKTHDPVNHPQHYTSHPSGVECVDVVEHYNFNVGSAIKYLWRAGLKSSDPIEDLRKAAWCVNREIERLKGSKTDAQAPGEAQLLATNVDDIMGAQRTPPHK